MTPQLLPTVDVEPAAAARAAVIWLHGLGADGHDFESIVPELQLPAELAVRFVFPHAPNMPVTINNGMVMPAWYDILALSIERKVDETGLRQSARAVAELIAREQARGISSNRIVLAGFSQGGAVAFECGLSYPQPLAGILALSSYFATHASIQRHPANQQTPIAIHHGTADSIVPEGLGRRAADTLTQLGYPVEYKRYAMGHSVCAAQIVVIAAWLRQRLG